VSGEIENVTPIGDEDRHIRSPIEDRRKLSARRVIHQHRAHAMARLAQNPRNDEPALRDEETLRAQALGVGDFAEDRDPRVVGAFDSFN